VIPVSVFKYQMRSTKKVSVWPVAFVGGLRYESPKVNTLGKVYGWKTVFDPHRPFAIDMAGFAVNLRLILSKPQAYFKLRGVKGGYQESSLLRELVTLSDLEPKAANCTKVGKLGSLHVVQPLHIDNKTSCLYKCWRNRMCLEIASCHNNLFLKSINCQFTALFKCASFCL